MPSSSLSPALRFAFVLAFALVATATAACRTSPTNKPVEEEQLGSDAQREPNPSGEVWRATTRTPGASPRPSWVTIREEVRLDPRGRLTYADTIVADDIGSPEVRIVCEPREHRVVIERGGRHVEWIVPSDQPWILAPVRGPTGEAIPTPLVAWTTWQATRNSEWVHLVTPLEQTSYSVPRDQYVVDQTVIVGEQSVHVDEQFVRSIQIGGVELARGAGRMHSAFRFRGG